MKSFLTWHVEEKKYEFLVLKKYNWSEFDVKKIIFDVFRCFEGLIKKSIQYMGSLGIWKKRTYLTRGKVQEISYEEFTSRGWEKQWIWKMIFEIMSIINGVKILIMKFELSNIWKKKMIEFEEKGNYSEWNLKK